MSSENCGRCQRTQNDACADILCCCLDHGMSTHTLLGQLYGRETMLIKALFSVISEIEVEALPSYTSQVLDRLKKERVDGKLSDELSAFIDQKLVEKEDLEKRIADQIYDEHEESVKGHLFEYRFQKAVTAMKREEYKKEKGEIEEKLGHWIAVANDFKRNAGSNRFLVEHETIIELLQEKLHNCECELAKCHYDDYYRQQSEEFFLLLD